MIRPLTLLILLAASPVLLAQPLYKWVEADGSITFSVKPPPDGVSFETVEADDGQSADITPATGEAETTPEMAKALAARSSETLPAPVTAAPSPSLVQGNEPSQSNASTARFKPECGAAQWQA